MPHDKYGTELRPGDCVNVQCIVEAVQAGVDYCNVNLRTVDPMPPYTEGTCITLNTLQTSKAISRMGFGEALEWLKLGNKIARAGWNGKGMWLKLQTPDAHSKMTLPYIYMKTADDKQVPWLASQTDMLTNDWTVVA